MDTRLMTFAVLAVAIIVIIGLLKFSDSRKWVKISGEITQSSFSTIKNSSLQQDSMAGNRTDFKVSINYSFQVKGERLSGNSLYAGLPSVVDTQSAAQLLMDQYPIGKVVNVYYNPEQTTQSALITSKNVPAAGIIVILLFILSIGSGIVWLLNSNLMAD